METGCVSEGDECVGRMEQEPLQLSQQRSASCVELLPVSLLSPTNQLLVPVTRTPAPGRGRRHLGQVLQAGLPPPASSGQDVAPLAAPDHEGDHGQGEEDRDEDEDGERVVGRVHEHHLLVGAVGEEVLVDADDVALHQRVGPVAVHQAGLGLRAQGEQVVLAGDGETGMRGQSEENPPPDLRSALQRRRASNDTRGVGVAPLKEAFNCL